MIPTEQKHSYTQPALCMQILHVRHRADGLLRQVQPLLRTIGVPTLVLSPHRVEVHDLNTVPGVHAEAEELHRAADIVSGEGQVDRALDGRLNNRRGLYESTWGT